MSNPNRRCAHGKLFSESCPGCGYVHPRDRGKLADEAARLYLWQQIFGGAIALGLMVLALLSLRGD